VNDMSKLTSTAEADGAMLLYFLKKNIAYIPHRPRMRRSSKEVDTVVGHRREQPRMQVRVPMGCVDSKMSRCAGKGQHNATFDGLKVQMSMQTWCICGTASIVAVDIRNKRRPGSQHEYPALPEE
jgi:hypothetical protein